MGGAQSMNIKRICVLYFSPTGGTEKIARLAAGNLAEKLGLEPEFIDFTRPENRQAEYRFQADRSEERRVGKEC